METSHKAILEAALRLAKSERVQLAEQIIASLEPEDEAEVDAAWVAEIERRFQELERGAVEPVPWSKVKESATKQPRGQG